MLTCDTHPATQTQHRNLSPHTHPHSYTTCLAKNCCGAFVAHPTHPTKPKPSYHRRTRQACRLSCCKQCSCKSNDCETRVLSRFAPESDNKHMPRPCIQQSTWPTSWELPCTPPPLNEGHMPHASPLRANPSCCEQKFVDVTSTCGGASKSFPSASKSGLKASTQSVLRKRPTKASDKSADKSAT